MLDAKASPLVLESHGPSYLSKKNKVHCEKIMDQLDIQESKTHSVRSLGFCMSKILGKSIFLINSD